MNEELDLPELPEGYWYDVNDHYGFDYLDVLASLVGMRIRVDVDYTSADYSATIRTRNYAYAYTSKESIEKAAARASKRVWKYEERTKFNGKYRRDGRREA